MADIDRLVNMCRREAKMRPVLPLGFAMKLGAIGRIEGGAFRQWGTSETLLAVAPGKPLTGGELPLVELQSGRDVQISALAKGATSATFGNLAKGKARIEVDMGSSRSFVAAAGDVKIKTLSEPHRLVNPMLRAYMDGLWDPDYVVVYEIGVAQRYSAILANIRDTKLLLSASAGIGSGALKAGDLAGNVSFEQQTSSTVKLIGGRNVVAFFNAYRVAESFWGKPVVRTAAAAFDPTKPAGQQTEVTLPRNVLKRV